PPALSKLINVEITDGNIQSLERNELLVSKTVARQQSFHVGERIRVQFARTGFKTLTIGGIYKENQILGSYVVSNALVEANFTDPLALVVAVKAGSGLTPAQSRDTVAAVTKDFPNLKVQDQSEFKAEQRRQINQFLLFIYIMLFLAIIIAFFGIMNT